ncbi:MAG: flagellar biosynthesis protein FlaG [Massilibacillus sp.]|jgi:flagellar protein FlaG|nr:flagellar biosynthesis protein FlaG [Massilibacillus sp.]
MNVDVSLSDLAHGQSAVVDTHNTSVKVSDQSKTDSDKKEQRLYSPFTKDQLDDLVSEANKLLSPELTEMHYVLHDKLNKYYVQVEDSRTHQVIREIPPKKFMDMYAAIAEKLGLIVNKRV